MDPETFDLLRSPLGAEALAAAAELGTALDRYPASFDRLRKRFPAELARAALDTAMLREKARAKFTRAAEMFFTRESLEMATSEPVANHRATRFAGYTRVADLGCGIGGDAIAMAAAGHAVVAVERDPLLARMAEANLAVHGLTANVVCGDALAVPLDVDAAFADPGRRPGGRRTLDPEAYEPPVSALVARFPRGFPLAIKVAPGIDREALTAFDADPEFVSRDGELKECMLAFGSLRTGTARATVLPGPHTLVGTAAKAELGDIASYVYDPDPAVSRAGLMAELGELLGAHSFDPGIAFLTADTLVSTPFASAYRIEAAMPFRPRKIGEWLRAHGIGRATIVKRGSSADADALVKGWKLRGDGHRAVLLTRLAGEPTALVGEREDG